MDSESNAEGSPGTQWESTGTTVSRLAQQDKVPWYSKPNLRFLYILMVPSCLGVEMTTGFDAITVTGLQAVPSWLEYFHHPHSVLLGLIVSVYSLGGLAVIPFASSTVDKMGRRYPILLGSIIAIIGGIIQGSALNLTTFMIARFLFGFSNVLSIIAAAPLIGELSHPKERAVISCLFNGLYYADQNLVQGVELVISVSGAIAAALVVLQTYSMSSSWAWRIPSFLQIVPGLLQLSFILFVPESPRWLVSKGRGSEAYAILVKYHGEGDQGSEFVKAEYSQIEEVLDAEMKVANMGTSTLYTPGIQKRVIIAAFLGLFTQWSGVGLISYYLVPVLDTIGIHDNRTKNIINLARSSWSLITCIVAALIAPRYPRRRMFLGGTISLSVVFVAWTIASAEYSLTNSKIAAQVVLIAIFLYIPAYSVGFVAMVYPFLVELFPFHVRAKGVAVYQFWYRTASLCSCFVDPIGIGALGWRWYLVYCVWNAFQVVFIYVMFPETSGRTLEELTFLYEDDREHHSFGNAEAEPLLHGRRSGGAGI